MAQRIFRSDDTSLWADRYGSGSDGAGSLNTATDATANTTLTGTATGTAGTAGSGTGFANGKLVLIHQTQGTGAGTWELNKISSVGGGTNWTMAYPFMNTYGTGAQVYLLKQYTTATVNTSQTITGQPWGGSTGGIYVLLANISITVTGTINVQGARTAAGNGAVPSGGGFRGGSSTQSTNSVGNNGESPGGTSSPSSSANGMGGGGGGGNANFNVGGGGGYGTAGGAGSGSGAINGAAGGTGGTVDLISMHLGGAGGGATGIAGVGNPFSGANGGGIVILIAPTITVTGSITTNGGAGTDQRINGGGGAGGSVLLKGQTLVLGSSLITATGGVMTVTPGGSETPGSGGAGIIHADWGTSISGTTSPTVNTRQDLVLNAIGNFFFAM